MGGVDSRPVPLPASLLDSLEGQDEVLVTSRSGSRTGTVPMGFALAPPGVVYLLTFAFSLKARRWEVDPWVRLTEPAHGVSAEGTVHPVGVDELEAVTPWILDRFVVAGAATPEALRRLLESGTHHLLRVEGG
jgi:hypothetical protein